MNILTICSALNNSYLGLKIKNQIQTKIIKSDENYHSLYLISEIQNFLKNNSISAKDLNMISVNCGPGSFTGIRVALTIAKVMAGELNLPLVPLNTAEILLKAYDKKYLIMDARRDMYFIGTKDNIELAYKDKININKNEEILCDKRSLEIFPNAVCYEEKDIDLAKTMLDLAQDKYNNSNNKDEFNYLSIKANYIQTPPVF